MAENNLEEKIDAGFRGVNARLDTLDGRLSTLDGRVSGLDGRLGALDVSVGALDDRVSALDVSVNGRVDALDKTVNSRIDSLDKSGNARLDTLDKGFNGLRTDVGDLKAHLDEVRDALLADNVKTRESTGIKIDALRADMNVCADGVIAHTAMLENHETRIQKLETR